MTSSNGRCNRTRQIVIDVIAVHQIANGYREFHSGSLNYDPKWHLRQSPFGAPGLPYTLNWLRSGAAHAPPDKSGPRLLQRPRGLAARRIGRAKLWQRRSGRRRGSLGGCLRRPSGIRHIGGANLNRALVRNVRTLPAMLRERRKRLQPRGRKYRCAGEGRTAP